MMRLLHFVLAVFLAAPAAAEFEMTILHTNDVHARFEPINAFDQTCGDTNRAAGACFGGAARLATAIEAERSKRANTVLLDAGDQFQGSLFYTRYKGALAAEVMNQMRYDAMVVGNHEFDDGPEVLRRFVDRANFPVLMSNANMQSDPDLSGVIPKSVVIERGGERIGLIGITAEDTHLTSSPGPHIQFTDAKSAVRIEVQRLTDEGVTKIILLSHIGYLKDLEMAQAVDGIDVIVGGHSNTYLANDDPKASGPYPTMVGDTAVVQAYAYGKYLGKLDVVFDATGRLVSASGEPLLMDSAIAENPDIKMRVSDAAIALDAIRSRVVAATTTAINADRAQCRTGECQMGTLVADAMLARGANQGVEIAILNAGGLRASLGAGDVTMGDVLTVLPFQNTLSTFQISGQTLLETLEHGVSAISMGDGRFPQVAGVTFSVAVTAARGNRIRNLRVGDRPVDLDRIYTVASNSFMRGGGDGFAMLTSAKNAYDFGPDIADVVAEFLAANAPYTPYTDGRISRTMR